MPRHRTRRPSSSCWDHNSHNMHIRNTYSTLPSKMASGSDELSENSSSAVKRRKIGKFDEIEKSSEPAELSHPKRKIKFQLQNSDDLEGIYLF